MKTIGYIFSSLKPTKEDKLFINLAKDKKVNLVLLNTNSIIDDEFLEKMEKCDLIFNNTASYLSLELIKTAEHMGKKTIDNSSLFYYTEDKWMFYLKCKKHGIKTPRTILLSDSLKTARKTLIDFNEWPVVLKRINGEQGDYVRKAENPDEAIEVIKKLWNKSDDRIPIIAQEMIKSCSYRVTVIGDKMVQFALKDGHGWKATGLYAEKLKKFVPDDSLKKIISKISKFCDIKICGIDFVKKEDEWAVLEVNAEPSFEMFTEDMQRMIDLVLDFLKKEA